MSRHYFDPELAEAYGIEEAILIHALQHWIGANRQRGDNLIEGRTWSFDKYSRWLERFPYFKTPSKMRRVFESLVQQGVLMKKPWNLQEGDKTNWYAFVDEGRFLAPVTPSAENVRWGRDASAAVPQDHITKTADGLPKTFDAPPKAVTFSSDGLPKTADGLTFSADVYADSVSNPIRDAVVEERAPAAAVPGETPAPELQARRFLHEPQHEKAVWRFFGTPPPGKVVDEIVAAIAWHLEEGREVTAAHLTAAIENAQRCCRERGYRPTAAQLAIGLKDAFAAEEKRQREREAEEREQRLRAASGPPPGWDPLAAPQRTPEELAARRERALVVARAAAAETRAAFEAARLNRTAH